MQLNDEVAHLTCTETSTARLNGNSECMLRWLIEMNGPTGYFFVLWRAVDGCVPTRSVSFEVARLDVFRAKGPSIYLAQANGLGDTQTRE